MSVIPRGRFVWFDLMTNDPKAAEDFYTDVAGWGTQQWDGRETQNSELRTPELGIQNSEF